MEVWQNLLVYLTAAVFVVPLFAKLGLGAVLGYLVAGIVIGPGGLGLIDDPHSVLHFSELGVVLLLFLIGLELQPQRLWEMRRGVFGLGGAQLVGTTAVITVLACLSGLPLATAGTIGAGLSLSSTAFALQLLSEKNELSQPHGQAAFGILLFQDLAVVPLLAILPLLGDADPAGHGPIWVTASKTVAVLAVVVASRFVLRPLFRVVASVHMPELFSATALFVVVGTALGVSLVGLSMALGAFLAGMLLADSEYRHELEADIEPFKGMLLGLFFIAVGMSVNVPLVREQPGRVVALVCALVAVKAVVLYACGRVALGRSDAAWRMALIISQGGEFAFVLFRLATNYNVMPQRLADLLIAVVSMSMALTPLLLVVAARLERWLTPAAENRAFDVAPTEDAPVIIAGFGRVGQIVARVLRAKRVAFTALDIDPEHIEFLKTFGSKVFFGDASRLDLLRAARADKARVLILAIDQPEASLRTARIVLEHFPHLQVIARARNRVHAYELMRLGIQVVIRDTFHSSLEMTHETLLELGLTYSESRQAVERFHDHDERLVRATYQHMDDLEKLRELSTAARRELESLFARDAQESSTGT